MIPATLLPIKLGCDKQGKNKILIKFYPSTSYWSRQGVLADKCQKVKDRRQTDELNKMYYIRLFVNLYSVAGGVEDLQTKLIWRGKK